MILNKIKKLMLRSKMPSADSYEKLFTNATERTKNLRIETGVSNGNHEKEIKLSDNFFVLLENAYKEIICNSFNGKIINTAGQCFNVNMQLNEILEENGITTHLTWGSVYEKNSGRLFGMQTKKIIQSIVQNRVGSSIDMHCWLTLPSLEIVDVTLMQSYAKISKNDDYIGRIVADYPANLPTLRYEPQFVGPNFPFAAGFVKGMIF